jgi:predicted DCC family thiol-disulfide oxidoreductase YuxK
MLRMDRKGSLRYCRLQGPLGQEYLRAAGLPTKEFSTIVFVPDWAQRDRPDFRLRTEGIVAAMCACGGWGTFVGGVIGLMPNRFGNGCYELVARMRYHMFGPWRACPLPNPEWAKRFID